MLGRLPGNPNLSQSSPPHHRAATEEDPYCRMKLVLRWYLSGFYKKPKVRGTYGKGKASAGVYQPTMSGTNILLHGLEETQLSPPWPQILRGGGQS